MSKTKRNTARSFLTLGIIFLVIGFVQQDLTFSFEIGMFNMGLILRFQD